MSYPMVSHTKNSLDDLRIRWRFLSASVKQDPNAAPYVADVAAFEATWNAADQKRISLEDALADAETGAIFKDRQLDGLADDIWTVIYGNKKVPDDPPLKTLYFGSATLFNFKRPVLGAQLTGAVSWPANLNQAVQPSLLALAPKAAAVVPAADAAGKQLAKAISDLDLFMKGGELQKTFDAFNALCATVHAGLKKFALAHPELKLGAGYAGMFFMHEPRSSQPTTVGAAAALVAQLQQKLGAATKTHDDLVAKAKAKADAIAAHNKAVADAAAKAKQAEQLKKDAAAAKKAAAKLKPKKK